MLDSGNLARLVLMVRERVAHGLPRDTVANEKMLFHPFCEYSGVRSTMGLLE